LLDGRLPKVDGFEVCRRIRHDSQTPVIMLTARDREEDVVRGLRSGADDYVKKPFSSKELGARIDAVLRRYRNQSTRQTNSEFQLGNLWLDPQSHTAILDGEPIQFTVIEFRVLYLLAMNAGRIVPYSRLMEYAWGFYDAANSNALRTHVCQIRRKLGLPAGDRRRGIRVVQSVGYQLVLEPTKPTLDQFNTRLTSA
jgi:DNA-binding response OmpR family regulator